MAKQTSARVLGVLVLFVVSAATGISGCASTAEPAPSENTAAPTSPTVSDDEALALIGETYAAFVTVIDDVLAHGGRDSQRLQSVATGSALSDAESDAREFMSSGFHSAGKTKVNNLILQNSTGATGASSPELLAYVCEDVSDIDLFDENGESLVSPERKTTQAFEIAVSDDNADGRYLVNSRRTWQGDGVCI